MQIQIRVQVVLLKFSFEKGSKMFPPKEQFQKEELPEYDSYIEWALDQEKPTGTNEGPIGLLNAVVEKSMRKQKKTAHKEQQRLAKLAAKVKNIDYARDRCKVKQAKREEKRKDQAARWRLADRNSGIGVPVISSGGSGQKREAPPSPPLCKKCNQRHW